MKRPFLKLDLSSRTSTESQDPGMQDPVTREYIRKFAELPGHLLTRIETNTPDENAMAHGSKQIKDGIHLFTNKSTVYKIGNVIVKTYEFTPRGSASIPDAQEFLRRFVGNEVYWQETTYAFLVGKEMDGIQVITPKVFSVFFDDHIAKAQITMEYIDVTPQKVDTSVMTKIDKWLQTDGIWHNDLHSGNIKYTTDGRLAILDYGSSGSEYGPRIGGKLKRKRKTIKRKKNASRTRRLHSKFSKTY